MVMLLAAVGVVAIAWVGFRLRQARALRALAADLRSEVVDDPNETRASTRFRAIVQTEKRPGWLAWGDAAGRADIAAANPNWAPATEVLNPNCTVIVQEIATGRAFRSYRWGTDLRAAEDHAASLNERAANEGVTKFLADL